MSDHQLADWRQHALTLETEVNKVVVGQAIPVRLITTAIFARGHVLLEGDVGVGKTTLLRAFTRGIGGGYQRIEGTIDLMPNDLPPGHRSLNRGNNRHRTFGHQCATALARTQIGRAHV